MAGDSFRNMKNGFTTMNGGKTASGTPRKKMGGKGIGVNNRLFKLSFNFGNSGFKLFRIFGRKS